MFSATMDVVTDDAISELDLALHAAGTALHAARSMTLPAQLARARRKQPSKVAYRFVDESTTYEQLDDHVDHVAAWLAGRGITIGDRVAVLSKNRVEVVEAYLAITRLGAICVPVNFRLAADEVAFVLRDSDAGALIVEQPLLDIVTDPPHHALVMRAIADDATPAPPEGAVWYDEAIAAGRRPPTVAVGEHDPAFIMYTSGTTGRPKGAVLSHFNLLMNTFNTTVEQGGGGRDEVWLSGLPLFHIGGLNGILSLLMSAGTVVLMPSGNFDAAAIVDTFERERVTACYLVPTQWDAVCQVEGLAERDLRLRRISWGASVAPPSVLQAMDRAFPGVPNFNAFGQTEMSSVTCMLHGDDAVRKLGSIGKPLGNVEVRIVDDDMNDVEPGQIGEIVYRGPTVLQGYWRSPDATAEAFRGGWFHSGDLVREDPDGFLFVADRKKDMIISGGENIYSAEVEATLDSHPKVREVAVIGVPHERWVETPLAVVVASDPTDPPTLPELQAHSVQRMASYKKPTALHLVEALPRNASGKVLKRDLRDAMLDVARAPGNNGPP